MSYLGIKETINICGIDVLFGRQLLYAMQDFQRFKCLPQAKFILQTMIDMNIIADIYRDINNIPRLKSIKQQFINQTGFDSNLVTDIINELYWAIVISIPDKCCINIIVDICAETQKSSKLATIHDLIENMNVLLDGWCKMNAPHVIYTKNYIVNIAAEENYLLSKSNPENCKFYLHKFQESDEGLDILNHIISGGSYDGMLNIMVTDHILNVRDSKLVTPEYNGFSSNVSISIGDDVNKYQMEKFAKSKYSVFTAHNMDMIENCFMFACSHRSLHMEDPLIDINSKPI